MYVRGMGRYRGIGRGLGDFVCPDFPDLSTCYDSSVAQAPAGYVVGAGPLAPGQTRVVPTLMSGAGSNPTATQWLNANATTVMIGAGILLALAALK